MSVGWENQEKKKTATSSFLIILDFCVWPGSHDKDN